jgi:type VI secretion system protein ImpA
MVARRLRLKGSVRRRTAVLETDLSGTIEDDAAPVASASQASPEADAEATTAVAPAASQPVPATVPDAAANHLGPAASRDAGAIDEAVAALCEPFSAADPCGPDLDLEGDAEYLNFFARSEGVLPTQFFSPEDGKPFDRSTVDLRGQIDAIDPLWKRSRDLRLLVMRARLLVLNRDLGGFATALGAIAEWLDKFWDAIHPRSQDGDLGLRVSTLGSLDLPTVIFPLQYTPLFEARRFGAVNYRARLIAAGEAKPRSGEQKHPLNSISEAAMDADPVALEQTRKYLVLLKESLGRIRRAVMLNGASAGLDTLSALVGKMLEFVSPNAPAEAAASSDVPGSDDGATTSSLAVGAPTSLDEAKQALAAIADYYARSEPSSPILPLVRQAHLLIGKSFFDVMSILVPTQMDKAAFQIGSDQFFELPVGKLPKLAEVPSAGLTEPAGAVDGQKYRVMSRPEAIALLELVQRFFRKSEPSSPIPMLCERARGMAERDFMSVLREVLPKAALKSFGAEK